MSDWSKYLATGIPVPPGSPIPLRKEIRNLSQVEMYLYFEGLAKFQQVDMDDPLSYYQIAGIHGKPYTTWPNEPWNNDIPETPKGGFKGFCTHSSILFLPWHRPYLALFEAALYQHVNDIASGIDDDFEDKTIYVAAAKNFRMPFWDWARKDVTIFPKDALNNETRVPGPSSTASVNPEYNPLFQSPFQDGVPGDISFDEPFTVRWPGQDPSNTILEGMKAFYDRPSTELPEPPLIPERNLTERVAYILLAYQNYGSMSNNIYRTAKGNVSTANAENWGSFEDFHNAIHNLTGGDGQMDSSNIDRLFSIWQALHEDDSNPASYVTDQKSGFGTFTVPRGGLESIDTRLYPFRDTISSWYTSRNVKRTEPFGYSYPETTGLTYPTTAAEKNQLAKVIEGYYWNLASMICQSQKGDETAGSDLLPQAEVLKTLTKKNITANTSQMMSIVSKLPKPEKLLKDSLGPSKPFIKDLAPDNTYNEWLVNVKAEKHTLNGAFTVHVFLGPVEEPEVYLWPLSPNHVGTFAALGQSQNTACGKCQDDQESHLQVTGQIPLTLALVERYLAQILPGLSESTVVPYLQKNLHWRVALNDGTGVDDRSRVDGLTVFVVSNKVTIPSDESQMPIYAPDVKIYPEITTKRDGSGRGDGTGLAVGDS